MKPKNKKPTFKLYFSIWDGIQEVSLLISVFTQLKILIPMLLIQRLNNHATELNFFLKKNDFECS